TIFDNMNVELPAITSGLLAAADLVRDNLVPGIAVLLGMAAGAVWALRRWGTKVARRIVFRRTAARELGELSRALGGFLGRGVPANQAFRALDAAYGDSFSRGALARVVERLESG